MTMKRCSLGDRLPSKEIASVIGRLTFQNVKEKDLLSLPIETLSHSYDVIVLNNVSLYLVVLNPLLDDQFTISQSVYLRLVATELRAGLSGTTQVVVVRIGDLVPSDPEADLVLLHPMRPVPAMALEDDGLERAGVVGVVDDRDPVLHQVSHSFEPRRETNIANPLVP